MTTDKILLENAAKAVCNGARFRSSDAFGLYAMVLGNGVSWNPLDDDGDALRLAVKLNIWFHTGSTGYALASSDSDGTYEHVVGYSDVGGDPCAAARRAIVLTVASIGASKE